MQRAIVVTPAVVARFFRIKTVKTIISEKWHISSRRRLRALAPPREWA
jgi:hypothetical protein